MIKSNSSSLFTLVNLILISFLYSCSGITVETKDNYEVVDLPDGSTAYLNHNSSISYDQGFEPREVKMEGEVYFSVVKGKSPFIVAAPLGEIKVIGTEFDVKSTEETLEVEVEDGNVELKTANVRSEVKQGSKALYNKGDDAIQELKANFKFRSWMKQLKIEFKKMGKEIKYGAKEVGKESKKIGKQLKKDLKDLKPK